MRAPYLLRRRLKCHLRATEAGHEQIRSPLYEAGIDIVGEPQPADALVVDLRNGEWRRGHMGAAIKAARQDGYGMTVAFLVESEQYADPLVKQLLKNDIVIQETATQQPLIRALSQSSASVGAARELGVRFAAAAGLGLPIEPEDTPAPPSLSLLQCDPGPKALEVMGELSVRTMLNAAIKGSQTLQALEANRADALLLLAGENRKQQGGLVKLLRRHGELSDIPIVVLESEPGPRHIAYWAGVGADDVLALTEVDAAVDVVDRLRARRRAFRHIMRQLRMTAFTTSGASSKISGNRFFEACVFERMKSGSDLFALGAIRLEAADGTGHHEALSEVAIYLATAMQPIDMITRVTPELFLVSLPHCDRHAANQTINDMATMISDLRFGPHDASCTFTPMTNTVTSDEVQNAASMVRLAIKGLSSQPHETELTDSHEEQY